MDKNSNKTIFIQNSTLKDRMIVYHDRLKRHLSNEMLYLAEQIDEQQSEALQLNMEKNQKNKTLFQTLERKDVRKYFSPLNLTEIEEEKKDEKQRQLQSNIDRIHRSIESTKTRIDEIRDLIREADDFISDDSLLNQFSEPRDHKMKNIVAYPEREEELPEISPDLQRTLADFVDNFRKNHEDVDILLEFEDEISLDVSVNTHIVRQIKRNIEAAMEECDVSLLLIQGTSEENKVCLVLNFLYEDEKMDTLKFEYVMKG